MQVFENPLLLEPILYELDWIEIQHLRQVSRTFRSCIDDINPAPPIVTYSIELGRSSISTSIQRQGQDYEIILYKTKSYDDLLEAVLTDFKANLRNQKLCLQELRIGASGISHFEISGVLKNYFLGFEIILKSRTFPLKVKNLKMVTVSQNEILQVLPYIDASSLEAIWIWRNKKKRFKNRVKFDEVAKLKQWKNVKKLFISYLVTGTKIRDMNLSGFARVNVLVDRITVEDLIHLKNELVKSPVFQEFQINFVHATLDPIALRRLMGHPHRVLEDGQNVWRISMTFFKEFLQFDYRPRARTVELKIISNK